MSWVWLLGCTSTVPSEIVATHGGVQHHTGSRAQTNPDLPSEPPPRRVTSETGNCREARLGILRSMNNSREESVCSRDEECATVTSPETPDSDAKLVVRRVDVAALDAVAKRHLDLCGATRRSPFSAEVFTMIEAKCVHARCSARETTFHPDPLD